jgi:hypothetical protein
MMAAHMDWFEHLTGFAETGYAQTQARLSVEAGQLVSHAGARRSGVGRLELASLHSLRARCAALPVAGRRTTVRSVVGDARALHADPALAGALFQVASQLNLLEMVSPDVTPEQGVARYAFDRTQGPACAMAAGAATIYRNYLVPVQGQPGQTATRQIDALQPLGEALATELGCSVGALWSMRNGYALCTAAGLAAITAWIRQADERQRDGMRGHLCVGLHHDVEVTDLPPPPDRSPRQRVSQAFCSALPVAYSAIAPGAWEAFARLVLEAAYEATLRAAALRHAAGAPATVLLTRLGGGAFGNDEAWIDDAMARALGLVTTAGLDVRLVSYGRAHPSHLALERQHSP